MPLLWLSAAFLAGIWLGSVSAIPKPVLFVIFILSALLAVLEKRFTAHVHLLQSWRKFSPLPLAVLLAALALGAWRYPVPASGFLPEHIASQNDRGGITFSAVVTSLPTSNGKTTSFKAEVVPGESRSRTLFRQDPGANPARNGDPSMVTCSGSPESRRPRQRRSLSPTANISPARVSRPWSRFPKIEVIVPRARQSAASPRSMPFA